MRTRFFLTGGNRDNGAKVKPTSLLILLTPVQFFFSVLFFAPSRLCVRSVFLLAIAFTARTYAAPNIVLIYADDIGYGDTSCYGATAVQTPSIDRLAREGLRSTDPHSAAATCTP